MKVHAEDFKVEQFEKKLRKYKGVNGSIIPLLQSAQEIFSYVPQFAIEKIAIQTKTPPSNIYGVATFYKQFRLSPVGKHIIRVCQGTACYVNDADGVMDAIKEKLGVEVGENTSDGLFTLQSVACLGCCSLAPVVMIDNETYGNLNPDKISKILDEYIERERGMK